MTPQLYLISPPKMELANFTRQLKEALTAVNTGFTTSFQLRLKDASDEQIIEATKTLLPICQQHDVAFIMNDRVDLCMELDCDGVHIGQEDLTSKPWKKKRAGGEPALSADERIAKAGESAAPCASQESSAGATKKVREQLGEEKILGITCHASKHLAMEAAEAGADYVAFGAFYPTTSKPKEKLEKWGTPTPDILEWWTTWTEIPCVAIGGITPENCQPLLAADFLAVITAVWNHPKGAATAVKEFHSVCSSTQ